MSCFFCESNYHLSQNCEIHVSDESRKESARTKNCCEFCLNYMGVLENENDSLLEKNRCPRCIKPSEKNVPDNIKQYGNCFTCFSIKHDTVYCPDRFKASKLFIPNINNDLLPRFMQIFDSLEQYQFCFSSPTTQNLIPLKKLKVIQNSHLSSFKNSKFSNKNIVLNGAVYCIDENSAELTNIFNHISSKTVVVKAEMVVITDSRISFQEFLQLLSPQTKILSCNDTVFTSSEMEKKVLSKIFEHIPNIEKFEYLRSYPYIDFSWLKDLNERKNKETLKEFKISLLGLKFSAMDLAIYMTQPSVKNIFISLYLDGFNQKPTEKLHRNIVEMLTDYFEEKQKRPFNESCLFITQELFQKRTVSIGYFTLL